MKQHPVMVQPDQPPLRLRADVIWSLEHIGIMASQRGASNITWHSARAEIARAASGWGKAGIISFSEDNGRNPVDILIRFATLYFSDGTENLQVGARSYSQPGQPVHRIEINIGGGWRWRAPKKWWNLRSFDLFSTAAHELGHAIGLGHDNRFGSIMAQEAGLNTWKTVPKIDLDSLRVRYANWHPQPAGLPANQSLK